MRVVFCGGKAVGYGVLQHLLKTDEVVGVFTNPSDENPSWYPSVKSLVKDIFYTTEPIDRNPVIFRADWLVCAYYDQIIPNDVLGECKSLNVHMGLIQEYRGCYPTTFPIIDGKDHAGVTIHEITNKIDGGQVYAQAQVSVDSSDTGQTLYYKCTGAAISLFIDCWERIKRGRIKPYTVEISKEYHNRQSFPSLEIPKTWPKDKQEKYIRALTFPPFDKPRVV